MTKPKIIIKRGTKREIVVDDMPFEEFLERLRQGNADEAIVTITDDGGLQVDLADYSFRSATWDASEIDERPERVLSTDAEVPALAQYILLLIPQKHRDPLLGDLREEFETILLPTYGLRGARLWYWWHTIISISPFALRMLKRTLGFIFISKLIGK